MASTATHSIGFRVQGSAFRVLVLVLVLVLDSRFGFWFGSGSVLVQGSSAGNPEREPRTRTPNENPEREP